MLKQSLAFGAAALVIGMALARCGSSKSSSPSSPSPSPSGTTAMPASFTSGPTGCEACVTCHGSDASMNPPVGGDVGHVVKNTKLDEATFEGYIKSGEKNGAMPACASMSQADMDQLYKYATGQ